MYSCTYEVRLHIRGAAGPRRTVAHTRCSCTYRGIAATTMYSCTYEVQLHHEVQLLIRGAAAHTRCSCTYRSIAATTMYSCTYEVQLYIRGTAAHTEVQQTQTLPSLTLRRFLLHQVRFPKRLTVPSQTLPKGSLRTVRLLRGVPCAQTDSPVGFAAPRQSLSMGYLYPVRNCPRAHFTQLYYQRGSLIQALSKAPLHTVGLPRGAFLFYAQSDPTQGFTTPSQTLQRSSLIKSDSQKRLTAPSRTLPKGLL
jgi:hypothetical protein